MIFHKTEMGNLSEACSVGKSSNKSSKPKMPKNLKKPCDTCGKKERPTPMFNDDNITCMRCDHFTCKRCVEVRWKSTWTEEDFYKPKIDFLPGLKHEVWNCPGCDVGFDRLRPDGSEMGECVQMETTTIGDNLSRTFPQKSMKLLE